MNIVEFISNWWKETLEYKERVLKDGGFVRRDDNVQKYIQLCKQNGMYDSIKFGWISDAGGKLRNVSSSENRWAKLHSLVTTNDATQTTSTSQPYLTGNIAPTEKFGMKNPNGGSNYMTHPTISFAANEAWSVTTVLNFNGHVSNSSIWGDLTNSFGLYFRNSFGARNIELNYGTLKLLFQPYDYYVGKNHVFTITHESSGSLKFYIDGILISINSESTSTNIISSVFISKSGITQCFFGQISAHIIRAQAPTPSQVAAEANFLLPLYPEIPSVTIGSQTWATSNCEMVATPQGNLIQNITANANVEKITNAADREFSSDTGFWTKGTGWAISGGVASRVNTGSASTILASGQVVSGKFYKITFTITNILSGSITNDGSPSSISRNTAGTYTEYYISRFSNVQFYASSYFEGSIDNVSVQEVGWSSSTELYDAIYAQTSGTDEQKTYAAVKAAGMWRYPNNDSALGAIYNKKFNKYALKLLSMDIAYYNTANPTAPWGYDVPTQAQLTTLSSVGGNALKKDGSVYWTTANGTNTTGFSAIGGGYIAAGGATTNSRLSEYFGCKDANVARELKDGDNTFNEVAITTEGVSLRLIKV